MTDINPMPVQIINCTATVGLVIMPDKYRMLTDGKQIVQRGCIDIEWGVLLKELDELDTYDWIKHNVIENKISAMKWEYEDNRT